MFSPVAVTSGGSSAARAPHAPAVGTADLCPHHLRHLAERQAAQLPHSLRLAMRPAEWEAVIQQFQRRLLAAVADVAPAPAPVPQPDPVAQRTPPAPVAAAPEGGRLESSGGARIPLSLPVPTLSQLREAALVRQRDVPSMLLEGAERGLETVWKLLEEAGLPWQARDFVTVLWWPETRAEGLPGIRLRADGALRMDPRWWSAQRPAVLASWILWALAHRLYRHATRYQLAHRPGIAWQTAANLWVDAWIQQRYPIIAERPWRVGKISEMLDVLTTLSTDQHRVESLTDVHRLDEARWYVDGVMEWETPVVQLDYGIHLDRIRRWAPFGWWQGLMHLVSDMPPDAQLLLLDEVAIQHRNSGMARLLRPEGMWGESTRTWGKGVFSRWWRDAGPALQDALHAARSGRG